MLSGKYVAMIADAEPDDREDTRDSRRSAALIAFVQALNGPTRSALVTLRGRQQIRCRRVSHGTDRLPDGR